MARKPRQEPPQQQEAPMADPTPQAAPVHAAAPLSGNGRAANIGGYAPVPTPSSASASEQQAVIAAQMVLITNQAVVVRDLEDQMQLSPPLPQPAPNPPGPTVNLNNVITTQTAAIRTQAAYIQHLQDLQTALGG